MKIKKMSYEGLMNALDYGNLSAKKIAKVNKRLEALDKVKRTEVPLNKSGFGHWGGPNGCKVSTVQDVLDALNTIEDKSLMLTWGGLTSDGESKAWGEVDKLTILEVNEDSVAYGRSFYSGSQVVLEVSSNA